MDIKIREMKSDDWKAVSKIYIQSLDDGKSTFQTQCPTYEEWDKSHLKDCRYVLYADECIAGWCALGMTSSRPAFRGVVEVSIYFDEKYRGLGLGKILLEYLCKESEKKGYWCLYSSIFADNYASISLHKKCGFREVGYREKIAKDKFGVWQDTVILEKRSKVI